MLTSKEIIERDKFIVTARKKGHTYAFIGESLSAVNPKWSTMTRERVRQILVAKAPELVGRL